MKRNNADRTLIIGSGIFVQDLISEISKRPQCKYQIIGIVSSDGTIEKSHFGYPRLGCVKNLHKTIQFVKPDVIIVALPRNGTSVLDHQLLDARICNKIRIEHADQVYEQLTGKLPIETLSPGGVIFDDEFKPCRMALLSTRILSFCMACAGLIIFLPLLLIISAIIKLDSKGPVFFIQRRMGYAGKSFKLIKFRTMSTSDTRTSEWEGDNIHRITRAGKWLRKYRLDELPQFYNVFCGEMNIVGPRPHPSSNFEMFVLVSRNTPECGLQIPYYSLRLSVRPGITGWAQVRYQYANNIAEEMEKLRFDLYYLKHYSFWLDLRILLLTVKTIFVGYQIKSSEKLEPMTISELSEKASITPLQVRASTN